MFCLQKISLYKSNKKIPDFIHSIKENIFYYNEEKRWMFLWISWTSFLLHICNKKQRILPSTTQTQKEQQITIISLYNTLMQMMMITARSCKDVLWCNLHFQSVISSLVLIVDCNLHSSANVISNIIHSVIFSILSMITRMLYFFSLSFLQHIQVTPLGKYLF